MSHTHVEPVKIKYHSTDLAVDVLKTTGYRGKCACSWVGPIRSHHSHARDDARRHLREVREAESATERAEAS